MNIELLKRAGAFTLAIILTAGISGCGKDEPAASNNDISQAQTETEEKPETQEPQSDSTEAYIQSAIKAADSLKRMETITTPDGILYSLKDSTPCYLDMNGNFYARGTIRQENVTDYAITNVDLYMLSGDQLLVREKFKPDYAHQEPSTPWAPVDCTDRMSHLGAANGAKLTEIFAEHNQLWGLDEKGRVFILNEIPGYFDHGEPNMECMKWTQLAVFDMAFLENSKDKLTAYAGIKRDGKVVASGEWADEILGWGPLAYITMQNDIAVGLTKDGNLKLAGPASQKLEPVLSQWHNITGVYACHDGKQAEIKAVDADGNFYWCKYNYKGDTYVVACKITPAKIEILTPDHVSSVEFNYMHRYNADGTHMTLNPDTLEWTE